MKKVLIPGIIITCFFISLTQNSFGQQPTSSSTENRKPVDETKIIKKYTIFNLHTWNYKNDDSDIRHYGPMLNEFHSAFGNDGFGQIGTESSLSQQDMFGINFTAIHILAKQNEIINQSLGLISKSQSKLQVTQDHLLMKMEEIEKKDQVIDELKSQIDQLQTEIQNSTNQPDQVDNIAVTELTNEVELVKASVKEIQYLKSEINQMQEKITQLEEYVEELLSR